jgi:hypothetical protein
VNVIQLWARGVRATNPVEASMQKSHAVALFLAAMVAVAPIAGAQGRKSGKAVAARAEAVKAGRAELMQGLQLSAAEKAKVKEIHAKYRAENKALNESLQTAKKEAKAARQKGDTAAARKIVAATSADREKVQASLERQRAELRAALSAENQKLFDANLKTVSAKRAEQQVGKRGAMKHGKAGRKNAQKPATNG